jgi:hypothetical protein
LNRYKAPLLEVVEEHLAHGDGQPRGLNEQPLFELLRGAVAAPQQVVHWSIEDLTVWVEQIRGTGERFLIYGEDALGLTIEALMPDRFVAFVDYKSDRMSTDILAGKVYSPLNLPNMAYDRIIVGLLGQEIHAEQHLVKDLGVPKDKAVRVLC